VSALDQEALGRLLLRVEAEAHRRGWDEPAAFYVLYDARDQATDRAYRSIMSGMGSAIRVAPYAAQSAIPAAVFDGNPAHALFRFNLNLRSNHAMIKVLLDHFRQPGFVGVAFQVETWMRYADSKEERDALGPKRFAGLVGSIEARHVMAADIAGKDYVVQRQRGEKPVILEDIGEMEGAVVESLRAIVAAIQGQPMPEVDNVPSLWNWDDELAKAVDP
jgi:hypothetical protein